MISYVFSLVCLPNPQVSPQINNNPHCLPPLFLPTSPLCSGGETTDFLPAVSLFFQMLVRIHLPFQHVLHYQSPQSNTLQPEFFFLISTRSSYLLLLCSPHQTPTGLLLAHSPLLSGIHFWSSLSPVAPLSPARLQGHSSLFQVRNACEEAMEEKTAADDYCLLAVLCELNEEGSCVGGISSHASQQFSRYTVVFKILRSFYHFVIAVFTFILKTSY